MTKNRLRVSTDGIAGPYLMVPLGQLAEVRTRLDRDSTVRYRQRTGVTCWVDADAISLDGKPALVVVNFGRGGDAPRLQALLDEAG